MRATCHRVQDLQPFIFKSTLVLCQSYLCTFLSFHHVLKHKSGSFSHLHVHTHLDVNIHTNERFLSSYPLTRHSVMHVHACAHTWSKVLFGKPLSANLRSCQCPDDSCVSNVSQTAIRKSFEILKSLLFSFGSHAFSSVKFQSAIAQVLAPRSFFPPPRHACSVFLACSHPYASLPLSRISPQQECAEWRLALSW